MNRKASKSKENCKDSKTESGRTYSSRRPCLRAKKGCGESCKCKECSNPFGMKILVEKSDKPKTRRRARTDMSGERRDGAEYMNSEKEEVSYGKWTDEENFLFMQHVVTNPETLNADTDNQKLHDLTKNFNASIRESGRVFENFNAHPKTEKQVKNKLSRIRRVKELAYRTIEEQLKHFLSELSQKNVPSKYFA